MRTALPQQLARKQSHRPRAVTVFAAAFVAGAAAAVGVNRALDVRLAQAKPRVESEAIFVALRSLPQGTPVTVWDVALRDWPKAMLPASAMRAHDSFSGQVLRHPLREGQPLLAIQLIPVANEPGSPVDAQPTPPPAAYTQVSSPVKPPVEADLWAPAEPAAVPPAAPFNTAMSQVVSPATAQPAAAPAREPAAQEPVTWPQPSFTPVDVPAPAPTAATASSPVVAPPVASPPATSTGVTVPPDDQTPPAPAVAAQPTPADQAPDAHVAGSQTTPPAEAPVAGPASPEANETSAAPQPDPIVPAPVATAEEPAPVAAADMPPVDEPLLETATAPQSPTVVAEIVAPEPVAEPVSVVAAAPAPTPVAEVAARPLPRYLVVPENIAVQADRSFAIPTTVMPPAQSQSPMSGPAGVQQLPPTAGSTVAAPRSRPSGQPTQQRQAVGQEPRQPQQRQGRQPAPATGNGVGGGPTPQPRLGAAMFPNITAGIEAIEGEWGRMRRDRTAAEEQPAPPRQRPVTAR